MALWFLNLSHYIKFLADIQKSDDRRIIGCSSDCGLAHHLLVAGPILKKMCWGTPRARPLRGRAHSTLINAHPYFHNKNPFSGLKKLEIITQTKLEIRILSNMIYVGQHEQPKSEPKILEILYCTT